MPEIKETPDTWAEVPAKVIERDPHVPAFYVTIQFTDDWTGLNATYEAGDKVSMPGDNFREKP